MSEDTVEAYKCLRAFRNGEKDEVVRLLPVVVNPQSYYNQQTILRWACYHGWIDIVRKLINEYQFDPKCRESTNDNTPLHFACSQMGNLHIIQYLINECRCNPMSKNENGNTPLHVACIYGGIEMVRYLIGECRCDPMSKNENGNTLLHIACTNRNMEMIQYLIGECRCDPMSKNNQHNTPLHIACRKKHIEMVRYLIEECPCDLTSKNENGDTPLHVACVYGGIKMVQYLIGECRCELMSKNENGYTPLHVACRNRDLELVRYLISEYRCDPMCTNNGGDTPLHVACRNRDLELVRYLIGEYRCDPMCRNDDGNTPLYVACVHGGIEMVQYLIGECGCDPMCKNNTDNTPLHVACCVGPSIDVIEYILSTGKIDPLAKNKIGKTPIQMVAEFKREKVKQLFAKFDKIKISHPVNSYVNVVLLGNPGAGKSTLAQVIIQRASGVFASIRGMFQYVKGVELCTAGIIPSKLKHRELGNVILHDSAGHPEYHSSHIAALENLLHGSAAVFIIVVSLSNKEARKHLQQWLSIVENECHKAIGQCHVITVASHIDEVQRSNLPYICRELAKISSSRLSQQSIVNCGLVHLDCRRLVGGELSSFTTTLFSACQSIRSTNTREMSLYCHMLYALLEEKKESVYTLDQLMAILRESENHIPLEVETVSELLSSLHTTGLIVFLKNNHTPGNSWVVARKEVLLTEVNGVLFAPDNFKEHRDIASNTGIISLSSLSQLFPQYSSDMLVVFLQYMELCQEISQEFLAFTNLMIKEEESSDETEKRLLFFPALIRDTERPQEIHETFQFGWCLQCSNPHQFFVPRFLHVLLLHLAYNYALPIIAHSQTSILSLHRLCDVWKNGIHWLDTGGVETVVELVDNNQCVVLLMSCQQDFENNMIKLRKEVISEITSLQKLICCSLEVEEFVIDPNDIEYPIIKPSERTLYNMKFISSCIIHQKPFVLDSKGHQHRRLQELLPFEPSNNIYSSGGRRVSVLGGRDPKVSYNSCV